MMVMSEKILILKNSTLMMAFFNLPFEISPWVTSMLPRDKGRAVKMKRRVAGISQMLLPIW